MAGLKHIRLLCLAADAGYINTVTNLQKIQNKTEYTNCTESLNQLVLMLLPRKGPIFFSAFKRAKSPRGSPD